MSLELRPEIERRLREAARERAISPEELIDRLLADFLRVPGGDAEAERWVRGTRGRLDRVWPVEDFSDWAPPDASNP